MAQSADMTVTSVIIQSISQHIDKVSSYTVIISQLPSLRESASLMQVHQMSTRPERLLRPPRPEPLRSRDDKASNSQAVVSIVRIPVKLLGVCRVLTPEVTCVLSQLV
jgi:hypothetical protein